MNNRQRKKFLIKKNARWKPKPTKFTFTDEERWNLRQTLATYITAALREFLNYPLWIIPDLITPPNEEGLGYSTFGKWTYNNEYWEKVTEVLKAQVSGIPTDVKVDLNHISAAEREWRTILVKMLWAFEQVEKNFEDEPFRESQEIRKIYDTKLQEGFNLFAKYFLSLTDF